MDMCTVPKIGRRASALQAVLAVLLTAGEASMGLKVGDKVTIKPEARRPLILEFQYHATVADRTDRGYYLETGDAVDPVTRQPERFGPFREEQLLHGWTDPEGRPRL